MRLIDADALIPRFDDYVVPIYTDEIIEAIQDEPTIDPVKHGHWEDLRIYGNFCRGICSVCKNVYVVSAWCGNCGAYMDEEEEE